MARPRTPIGTYGTISIRRQPSGPYVARTRYRDWDGRSRHVQTTAATRPAAERELKKKLAERSLFHPGFTAALLKHGRHFYDIHRLVENEQVAGALEKNRLCG